MRTPYGIDQLDKPLDIDRLDWPAGRHRQSFRNGRMLKYDVAAAAFADIHTGGGGDRLRLAIRQSRGLSRIAASVLSPLAMPIAPGEM
jgi:hypothetical protein